MILPLANAAYNERSGKLTGKIRTSDRKCGRSPQRNDCKPMIVVQSRMQAASGPLTQRGIVPSITSLQTVRAIVGIFLPKHFRRFCAKCRFDSLEEKQHESLDETRQQGCHPMADTNGGGQCSSSRIHSSPQQTAFGSAISPHEIFMVSKNRTLGLNFI